MKFGVIGELDTNVALGWVVLYINNSRVQKNRIFSVSGLIKKMVEEMPFDRVNWIPKGRVHACEIKSSPMIPVSMDLDLVYALPVADYVIV